MAVTIEQKVELELRACPSCGAFVALTADQWKRRQEGRDDQNRGYFCPNGHQYGWWESDAERERKKTKVAEAALAKEKAAAEELRKANDDLLSTVSRQKRELATITKRVKAGVCAECHRTFQNVASHIRMKHSGETARAKEIAVHKATR